ILRAFTDVVSGIVDTIGGTLIAALAALITELATRIAGVWARVENYCRTVLEHLGIIFERAMAAVTDLVELFNNAIRVVFDVVRDVVRDPIERLTSFLVGIWNRLRSAVRVLVASVASDREVTASGEGILG